MEFRYTEAISTNIAVWSLLKTEFVEKPFFFFFYARAGINNGADAIRALS